MPKQSREPIPDYLKTNRAIRMGVVEKLVGKKAFDKASAIKKEELNLFGLEEQALEELREEEKVQSIMREGKCYYYLSEKFQLVKNYRREVVMGLSIPLLIFIVGLILLGVISLIVAFIRLL
ncbi:MAG: hypothetical protein GF308_08940 [Candidatus Heimdallarchaeota archaeon]|nr:hypothetical protein [Candidatus Heimdallarchaeota archaeon]